MTRGEAVVAAKQAARAVALAVGLEAKEEAVKTACLRIEYAVEIAEREALDEPNRRPR